MLARVDGGAISPVTLLPDAEVEIPACACDGECVVDDGHDVEIAEVSIRPNRFVGNLLRDVGGVVQLRAMYPFDVGPGLLEELDHGILDFLWFTSDFDFDHFRFALGIFEKFET